MTTPEHLGRRYGPVGSWLSAHGYVALGAGLLVAAAGLAALAGPALALRGTLAAVFAVAGLAKLADPVGSRRALVDFGLPHGISPAGAIVVPLSELIVAAALLVEATVWWAAAGAVGLLLGFNLGIGFNLSRGNAPQCHCFGQLHSEPVGWRTLARNSVLMAGAGYMLWAERASGPAGLVGPGVPDIIVASLGGLALALAMVSGWLLLWGGRGAGAPTAEGQSRAVHSTGLPVGAPAPEFQLTNQAGSLSTLGALRARGKPVLLIFSDADCAACMALMPAVARWEQERAAALTIAVIGRGDGAAASAKAQQVSNILVQDDSEVAEAYRVYVTPAAVLVSASGAIASVPALGGEAISDMVARLFPAPTAGSNPSTAPSAAVEPGPRPGAPEALAGGAPVRVLADQIGKLAPAITLTWVSGEPERLAAGHGRPKLVLFWNPRCTFCRSLLADLHVWDGAAGSATAGLLLIVSGSAAEAHGLSISAPIGLDPTLHAARAFGVIATPSAALIDARGTIVGVAAGVPAVRELARAVLAL